MHKNSVAKELSQLGVHSNPEHNIRKNYMYHARKWRCHKHLYQSILRMLLLNYS